jgi:hypothetical protein
MQHYTVVDGREDDVGCVRLCMECKREAGMDGTGKGHQSLRRENEWQAMARDIYIYILVTHKEYLNDI